MLIIRTWNAYNDGPYHPLCHTLKEVESYLKNLKEEVTEEYQLCSVRDMNKYSKKTCENKIVAEYVFEKGNWAKITKDSHKRG